MTLEDKYDLNLPDAPDFISEPPKFTIDEMIAICEKMLPFWNKIRYEREQEALPVEEFILD